MVISCPPFRSARCWRQSCQALRRTLKDCEEVVDDDDDGYDCDNNGDDDNDDDDALLMMTTTMMIRMRRRTRRTCSEVLPSKLCTFVPCSRLSTFF